MHYHVYCCIITLHNSTSCSNKSVDRIVSNSLSSAVSSKFLCNFLYLWHYIFLKQFYCFLSFTFFRANFHEINHLYANRPFSFCPSTLSVGWTIYGACKNRPRNDLLCVEWDAKTLFTDSLAVRYSEWSAEFIDPPFPHNVGLVISDAAIGEIKF